MVREVGRNELLFPDESLDAVTQEGTSANATQKPWKIMIVDDEEMIHSLTKIVLKEYTFEGRVLEFVSGFSGEDACRLLQEHSDTAVLLLDVVMETDHAGLDVVNYARNDLNNNFLRIVIRTGQPGFSYENDVVTNYEVNGYVEKSDFTAQKLHTLLTTSLRSYRDLTNTVKRLNP